MTIKFANLKEMANELVEDEAYKGQEIIRKLLMNGPKYHSWLHIYAFPGVHDEMHCHNADQTFCCISGECTMYLKNGESATLIPGMVALIPGGNFYWLENTGNEKMVLLGSRAISHEGSMKIDYLTKKDLNQSTNKPPKSTSILI